MHRCRNRLPRPTRMLPSLVAALVYKLCVLSFRSVVKRSTHSFPAMSDTKFVNEPALNVPYFTPAQIPASGTAVDPQPDGKPIPKLFQPITIRGVEFQNRIFVRSLLLSESLLLVILRWLYTSSCRLFANILRRMECPLLGIWHIVSHNEMYPIAQFLIQTVRSWRHNFSRTWSLVHGGDCCFARRSNHS